MYECKMVSHYSDCIDATIAKMLDDGWELAGGMAVHHHAGYGDFTVFQLMIRKAAQTQPTSPTTQRDGTSQA